MAYDKEELFKLTTQEKLLLVEDLLNSIKDGYISDHSCEAFEKELDRRAKHIDDFPESLIPWEKVKRENEMIYSLSFVVDAEKDTIDAYNWYKKYSLELAENFKECLDSRMESIRRNPFTPSFAFKNYRSAKIQRFPYNIIFKIKDTEIQVMAVFHSSRNPRE